MISVASKQVVRNYLPRRYLQVVPGRLPAGLNQIKDGKAQERAAAAGAAVTGRAQ